MAWTITFTAPLIEQVVDVNGTVNVQCEVGVDGNKEPAARGYVYDEGDTLDQDPPSDATMFYVEPDAGTGYYKCSADVNITKAGGSTKPTLKRLTLRVWAGIEDSGAFETKKVRDRLIWGFTAPPMM